MQRKDIFRFSPSNDDFSVDINYEKLDSTSLPSFDTSGKAALQVLITQNGHVCLETDSDITPVTKDRLIASLVRWLSTQNLQSSAIDVNLVNTCKTGLSEEAFSTNPLLQFSCSEFNKWNEWFADSFAALQQQACRFIAKEWIRAIHPRKQSSHPYNGMLAGQAPKCPEETRPDYWPVDVEHREPDHIDKTARIKLLMCLLANTPHRQLNASSTGRILYAEDLLSTLTGKSPAHLRQKWPILQEMIRVRKVLEMYEANGRQNDAILRVHDFSTKAKTSLESQVHRVELSPSYAVLPVAAPPAWTRSNKHPTESTAWLTEDGTPAFPTMDCVPPINAVTIDSPSIAAELVVTDRVYTELPVGNHSCDMWNNGLQPVGWRYATEGEDFCFLGPTKAHLPW